MAWMNLSGERGAPDRQSICATKPNRAQQGGVPVAELCREHGMSTASFYKWRAKYGGMDASMIAQTKALEDENRRLKKMFAELSMQNELLKEALGKK